MPKPKPRTWFELAAAEAKIAEIDKRLAAEFPDYVSLINPAPLTVEEVQAELLPNEALVLFYDTLERKPTPEETFVWVITKKEMRWVRSELGTVALINSVKTLRCGLDAAAWDGGGAARCAKLLNVRLDQAPKNGDPLPFDLARALELYKGLFGQVEDLIRGKSLLIVPAARPLTSLPFQALVQSLPEDIVAGMQSQEVGWLGLGIKDLSVDDRLRLHWNGDFGVRIANVVGGKAADLGGLKPDDILLKLGNESAITTQQTIDAIRAHHPGTALQLSLWREGQRLEVSVVLGANTLRKWRPSIGIPRKQNPSTG